MADEKEASNSAWTPEDWRSMPAGQQPEWPNPAAVAEVVATLATRPPLVFAGEARRLTTSLATVSTGKAFVLQAGDCAESFHEVLADTIRDKLKVLLQMAVVLT